VRSLSVVVVKIGLQDALEVAARQAEQPVQAFGPDGSDPSLTGSEMTIGTLAPLGRMFLDA
jgi:hypothetical protein